MKQYPRLFKVASFFIDSVIVLLMIAIFISMAETVWQIFQMIFHIELHGIVESVANFFLLLEIILMLMRYLDDGYSVPVKYIILIGITAVSRELLLSEGSGLNTFLLALGILVLMGVLYLWEKIRLIQTD
ncbi:MAG: phosphate-starvation-inducible PsiE family protein [Enterococcus sp.]